jgi:hypothetical protein
MVTSFFLLQVVLGPRKSTNNLARRITARNTDAKAINPQNAEINDWSRTVAAWCQRMSRNHN